MSWNPLDRQLQEYASKRMRITEAMPGATQSTQLPSLAPPDLTITNSGGLTPRPLLSSLSGTSALLPDALTPNASGVLGVYSLTRQSSGPGYPSSPTVSVGRSPISTTTTLHGRTSGAGSLLSRGPMPISTMSEQLTTSAANVSVRSPVLGTRGFYPTSPTTFGSSSSSLRSPRFHPSTLSASSSASALAPPSLAQSYSFTPQDPPPHTAPHTFVAHQPHGQYQSPMLPPRSTLPAPVPHHAGASEPSSPAEPTEAPILDPPPRVSQRGAKGNSLSLPQPPVALSGSGAHKNQLLDGDILQQLMRYLNNLEEKIKFNRQVAVRLSVPFYRGKVCTKSEERHPFLSEYRIKTLSSRNCVACLYFRRGTVNRLLIDDLVEQQPAAPTGACTPGNVVEEVAQGPATAGGDDQQQQPQQQPPMQHQHHHHHQQQYQQQQHQYQQPAPPRHSPSQSSYSYQSYSDANPTIAQLTLATGTPAASTYSLSVTRTSPTAGGLTLAPLTRLSSTTTPVPAPYNWPLPSAAAAALLATGAPSPRSLQARLAHIQPGTSSITPIMPSARTIGFNPALVSPVVAPETRQTSKSIDDSTLPSTRSAEDPDPDVDYSAATA